MEKEKPNTPVKSLSEIVNPSHSALVVFDVQKFLVEKIINKENFLSNLKVMIEGARNKHVPIIYSKVTPFPKGFESPWRTFMLLKRYGVDSLEKLPKSRDPGSPESEISTEVGPLNDDIVVKKFTPSIFIGTNFEYILRNKNINTVIFTGIATEIGVDSSARDSSNRGFYTIVIQDCVSSWNKELHASSLRALENICMVNSASDILAEWEKIT